MTPVPASRPSAARESLATDEIPSGLAPDVLAERYDRPGPRYTSYPTAVAFTRDVDAGVYERRLDIASRQTDEPLSLYVHLPFCEHRCAFCACHVIVSRDVHVAAVYLDHLITEIGLIASRLGKRRQVTQYHWGGGTPTYYDVDSLARLHAAVTEHFRLALDAECAVEVDPRVTTTAQLEALRRWGFTRVSLGVQDVDPEVQAAIGRLQPPETTEPFVADCRRLGFDSVNIDLLYGLPSQTPESFRTTLDQVIRWRPDRLAVYGFALVPWVKPHQRRIDRDRLPDRVARLELLLQTARTLTAAGYVRIGMDHYALPTDELVQARTQGRLNRNFMGYTVTRAPDIIGFGASAIGDVGGAFVQNHTRLRSYYDAIEAGRLPTERGYVRGPDDEIRRYVITELMCNLHVRWDNVVARFPIDPTTYFAAEIARVRADLNGLADLADVSDEGIELTALGSLFPRNVAMVFDAYLQGDGAATEARYSRTV